MRNMGRIASPGMVGTEKTVSDAEKEGALFLDWVRSFPLPQRDEWISLLKQLTYGKENVRFSGYLQSLSLCIDEWTKKKINETESAGL